MPLPACPFDPAKSIYAGLSIIQLKIGTPLSAVAGAIGGVITKTSHGLLTGMGVIFVSGTGGAPLVAGNVYYVKKLTADTFNLLDAPGGSVVNLTAALSTATLQHVEIFEADKFEDDPSQSDKPLKRPDRKGVNRTRRTVQTDVEEKWTFNLAEPKRLPAIFSGGLSGRVVAKATIWVPDVDDADTVCSLKSQDDFDCVLVRDGKLGFGGDYSATQMKLTSNAKTNINWDTDVVVTP